MAARGGSLVLAACAFGCSVSERLKVATTTSVEASGLVARIQPVFEARTGLRLSVAIGGTGQTLMLLERGDVEAALTHDREAEEAMVVRGVAQRMAIMENDFVLAGPPEDPAGAKGRSIEDALRAITAGGHGFVSRGDDSGTHKAERRLWRAAGAEPKENYRETGQGQAETLLVADVMRAYLLVDTATFAKFREKVRIVPLVQGDPRLANSYAVLWRTSRGKRFAEWLRSQEARALMAPDFRPVP